MLFYITSFPLWQTVNSRNIHAAQIQPTIGRIALTNTSLEFLPPQHASCCARRTIGPRIPTCASIVGDCHCAERANSWARQREHHGDPFAYGKIRDASARLGKQKFYRPEFSSLSLLPCTNSFCRGLHTILLSQEAFLMYTVGRRLPLFFFLLSLLLWHPPASLAAEEIVRVAVPLFPTPAFPQMLAADRGLFSKRGLRVEFIRINSEPTTYQALVYGDVQATSGAPVGLVLSHLQGVDVVAVGSWLNIVPYTIVTRERISDLSQLRGKKIGVNRLGGRSALIVRVMMEDAGLDFTRDLTILQLGGSGERLAALISGGIRRRPGRGDVGAEAAESGSAYFSRQAHAFRHRPDGRQTILFAVAPPHDETVHGGLSGSDAIYPT